MVLPQRFASSRSSWRTVSPLENGAAIRGSPVTASNPRGSGIPSWSSPPSVTAAVTTRVVCSPSTSMGSESSTLMSLSSGTLLVDHEGKCDGERTCQSYEFDLAEGEGSEQRNDRPPRGRRRAWRSGDSSPGSGGGVGTEASTEVTTSLPPTRLATVSGRECECGSRGQPRPRS